MSAKMFEKILVANRGEIAVRILKTAKMMGIKTVACYSDADQNAMATQLADDIFHLGPSPANQSYLRAERYIEACKQTGAQAIHPGYGFVSENVNFAQLLQQAQIAFIGPNPRAIELMGDKITSKEFAKKAGVSTIPGHMDLINNAEEAIEISKEIGFPVMLKASAGGGGKGMRIAYDEEQVREGLTSARNEAKSAFGDDRIFIERFIEQPRHIEIQVLGDKFGNCIHLGERECSIQRRNQKVIEEAPSTFVDDRLREAMGEQAVSLAKAVDYDSAGTVEFIVDKDQNFYFLEMNTRLQVEHPVTEMVTGYDLVEQMIKAAAGEKLTIEQSDVDMKGWAIEARLYAEDPYRGFLPSIGRLARCQFPVESDLGDGNSIRVDTGVREGDEVTRFYDPMIAKVIGYGPHREQARLTLLRALDHCHIDGLVLNTAFLSTLLLQERFISGELSTSYIDDEFGQGFDGRPATDADIALLLSVAAFIHGVQSARGNAIANRMTAPEPPADKWTILLDKKLYNINIQPDEQGAKTTINNAKESHILKVSWRPGHALIMGLFDEEPFALTFTPNEGGIIQLSYRGCTKSLFVGTKSELALLQKLPEKEKPDLTKFILSPMPGQMVDIDVKSGDEIKVGSKLCSIEAMKMENIIRAESDGIIKSVHVDHGQTVSADELLIEME